MLFSTEKECCAAYIDACPKYAHCAAASNDASTTVQEEYWYPSTQVNTGLKICKFNNKYPPEYYTKLTFCMSLLFTSEDDCCTEYPEACEDTSGASSPPVSHGNKWYPNFVAPHPGILMCDYGSDYPTWMTHNSTISTHLFDTEAECCDRMEEIGVKCGNELDPYWFPVAYMEEDYVKCEFGIHYPSYMLEEGPSHLFLSEDECNDVWATDSGGLFTSPPTSSPTTAPPTASSAPTDRVTYWYPDTSAGQTANICKEGNDYPDYMLDWPSTFLFQDACGCCEEHDCSDVDSGNYPELQEALAVCDMTDLSATMPTEPVTEPATDGPTKSPTSSPTKCSDCYWYPDTGTGETDNICKYGNDYLPFMVTYSEKFLFDDACACCSEHDCGDSSNGDHPELEEALATCGGGSSSSSATPNPTTRAPTKSPTTRAPTKNPTTRAPTKNPTTSPSMNPTTSSPTPRATGTNGKYYYAYPDVLNGNAKCLWGTDYPDFMELEANKPDWLFDSIEECCAVKGYTCTASPSSSPTKTPTSSPIETEYWYPDIQATINKCIRGSDYDPWMANERYGMNSVSNPLSYLFTTYDLCCAAHGCDNTGGGTTETDGGTDAPPPSDVVTYVDEGFEAGNSNALPWTFSGAANWQVSTSRSVSPGTHSLRSGDLNGIGGKSSVVSIKVDSSLGAYFMFDYYVGIGAPFDRFEFRVDGDLKHMDKSPSGEWERYLQNLSPGPHTISFHVITYSPVPSFDRNNDVDEFGDGFVYLDNLEFQALSRRRN